MIPNKCEIIGNGKFLRIWNYPAEDTAVDKPITDLVKETDEYKKALMAGGTPVTESDLAKAKAKTKVKVYGVPSPVTGQSKAKKL